MSSYREVYNEQVEGLFGSLKSTKFDGKAKQDKTPQEGTPAIYVPFSFGGSGYFATGENDDVLIYIPDTMVNVVEARVILSFREYFAPATSVSSGGGSTSGSGGSSSPTSASEAAHRHQMFFWQSDTVVGAAASKYGVKNSGGADLSLELPIQGGSNSNLYTYTADGGHSHVVTIAAHTHTTPAHSHDLAFGVYKEAFPASIDVELRIYSWSGTAWTQVGSTITGLVDEVEDVDLAAYITGPGKYRLHLQSDVGAPQGGRLGYTAAGHIVGAIQPR
jgi:hypothetical protein